MRAQAEIVAVGARTAVGLDALQTAMLYRAGAAGMTMAPLVDADGDHVTMCVAATLDPLQVGWERGVALAVPALEEAVRQLTASGAPLAQGSVHLALCLDEPSQRRDQVDAAAALTAGIVDRTHALLPGTDLEVFARGGAGGAAAVMAGLTKLQRRSCDVVLIGAVHSDYDPGRIARLSGEGRLFKPDNLDALIPGEAAVFVAMTRDDVARRMGWSPMARLIASATSHQPDRPPSGGSDFDARGLVGCIREAGAPLSEEGLTAGWALTDLTFEQRRVFEWQAMLIRTRKLWAEPYVVDSPAQRLGYLGPAAIPLGMALASLGFRHGSAPAPIAMAHAGSEGGLRGAVLLAEPAA